MLGLLVTKFSFSRWPGCSFDSTCYNEILEFHFVSVRLMVFAGPASDRILVLQIARFVVLTGPAADEILELHSARLMLFAELASNRIFVLQITVLWSRLGLPRMKFWSFIWKAHGFCWTCL